METGHLREFVVLADSLSFSETAKKLYITQSTLSRHIASLEEELGCRLFYRDSHHVRLTAEAEQFREDAKVVLSYLDAATTKIASMREHGKRPLRIGYLYDAAADAVAPFGAWLDKNAPGVRPEFSAIEYAPLMRDFEDHLLDIVITMDIDENIHSQCEVIDLYPDRYCLCVSQKHPLARRESVTVEELLTLPDWILPDPKAIKASSFQFARVLGEPDRLRVKSYYYDLRTLLHEIAIGSGVSLIAGHHRLSSGDGVAFIPIDGVGFETSICIAWRKDAPPWIQQAAAGLARAFGMKNGRMSKQLVAALCR